MKFLIFIVSVWTEDPIGDKRLHGEPCPPVGREAEGGWEPGSSALRGTQLCGVEPQDSVVKDNPGGGRTTRTPTAANRRSI